MSLNVDFQTVEMVHNSWEEVKKIPNSTQVAGELLFRNIFRIAPAAWELFPFAKGFEAQDDYDAVFQTPMFSKHAKHVVGMLDTAVHLLGPDLQILEDSLVTLGASHVGYGVLPEHYPVVGQALMETLATALGESFTPELKTAWAGVYGFVTDHMLKGANESLSRITIKVYGPDKKKTVSLDECLAAMVPHQTALYYVTSNTSFPALERLLSADVIVLKMGKHKAGMVVTNLQKYLGRDMLNVADCDDSHWEWLDTLDASTQSGGSLSPDSPLSQKSVVVGGAGEQGLDFHQAKEFCAWFQATLGPKRVLACTPTCRFASLPARVVAYESGLDIQRHMAQELELTPLPKKQVEINPGHELVVQIQCARAEHPLLAELMAEQVHDHCLIQAGLEVDSRGMVNRMTDISLMLLKSKNASGGGTVSTSPCGEDGSVSSRASSLASSNGSSRGA